MDDWVNKRWCHSFFCRSVEDLPPFPTDGVPPVVGHLVREMLDPNPRRRISAEMAANICQLLLWMPSPWLSGTRYPGTQDLLQASVFFIACQKFPEGKGVAIIGARNGSACGRILSLPGINKPERNYIGWL